MESYHKKPLTIAEARKAHPSDQPSDDPETNARINRIDAEFARGFDFIESLPKTVSIFGSTRAKDSSRNYKNAQRLARLLASEENFGVVTGGGPGIMEAANRGAYEAGGISAGLTIQLPTGQQPNPYVQSRCDFHYFFIRKVILSFAARVYIYFPGGYGTLDEFLEIITLIQTNKIQKIPVVCFGSDFWQPLQDWMHQYLLERNDAIEPSDLNLFTITDSAEEVVTIARAAARRV